MSRDFNGTTNRIDWASVATPSGAITISAWVDMDAYRSSDYIYCIHDADNTYGLVFNFAGAQQIQLVVRGSTSLYRYANSSGNYEGAGWTHVLVTWAGTYNDATTIHLYRDGVEETYGGGVNGVSETTHSGLWSLFGRYNDDNRNANGRVAEVAVWNRVLASGEITGLAAGNAPSFYNTNLQFYYSAKTDTMVAEVGGTGTNDGSTFSATYPAITYPATLSGALTSSGALDTDYIPAAGEEYLQDVSGALTSAGVLLKKAGKPLAGALTFGNEDGWYKDTLYVVSGALTPSGVVVKRSAKALSGAVTSAGTVVKTAGKVLVGAVTSAGSIIRTTGKVLAGALTPSGVAGTGFVAQAPADFMYYQRLRR